MVKQIKKMLTLITKQPRIGTHFFCSTCHFSLYKDQIKPNCIKAYAVTGSVVLILMLL